MTLHDLKNVVSLSDIIHNGLFEWNKDLYMMLFKNLMLILKDFNQILVGREDDWDLFLDDIYYDLDNNRFALKLIPKIISLKKSSCEDVDFLISLFSVQEKALVYERK